MDQIEEAGLAGEKEELFRFIRALRGDYTREQFQEALRRISGVRGTPPEVVTFTSRRFKKSFCNNTLLNVFLRSIAQCLNHLHETGMKDGRDFLREMGKCLLMNYQKTGKGKGISPRTHDEIAVLADLWVREGLARKVKISQRESVVEFQIHSPFGSQVWDELCSPHRATYLRPCPLQAMLMAKCAELGYGYDVLDLNFDRERDIWYIAIKLIALKSKRHGLSGKV